MIPTSILETDCVVWACFRLFLFALDLKSEIKRVKNALSTLIGKTVGTGSIKVSRTVLPGWDPE
jgi:hypothetical protein